MLPSVPKGWELLQDTGVEQAGVNTHPISFLLWAEVGQAQEGTEATRTTSPPGKHTWLLPPAHNGCPYMFMSSSVF